MRQGDGKDDSARQVRLDKWLWAARFFKTRALAHEAIDAGRVLIDGVRAKPSRTVAVGQELCITTSRGEFVVKVTQVVAHRASASVAATFFSESEESKLRRVEYAEMHRLSRISAPDERPNTQDRRLLRRLKEGDYEE
jgi:ribosome-associated heat shock protein Hsp15